MSPARQRQYLRHLSYYLHRKLMKALLARKLKRSLVYVQRHTNAISSFPHCLRSLEQHGFTTTTHRETLYSKRLPGTMKTLSREL
jgi:hypothetical protein